MTALYDANMKVKKVSSGKTSNPTNWHTQGKFHKTPNVQCSHWREKFRSGEFRPMAAYTDGHTRVTTDRHRDLHGLQAVAPVAHTNGGLPGSD